MSRNGATIYIQFENMEDTANWFGYAHMSKCYKNHAGE